MSGMRTALYVLAVLLTSAASVSAWAQGYPAKTVRVIDATSSNAGAVKVDGKMVDKPVILKAERILAAAQT